MMGDMMIKPALAVFLCMLSFSSPASAAQAEPTPPKAYLIAEIAVHDAATYEGYKAAVAPLVGQFGGRYLTRGGVSEALEGEAAKGRVIVLEFPSVAAARSFVQSEAYRPVAAIRHKSATSRIIMVEGVVP